MTPGIYRIKEKSVMAGLTRQLRMPMASIGNTLFPAVAVIEDRVGARHDKGRVAEKNKKTLFSTTNDNKILCKPYRNQPFMILHQNRKNEPFYLKLYKQKDSA